MKIYWETDNIYDAVDSVVINGIATLGGTQSNAVPLSERIMEALKPYNEVVPLVGFTEVPLNGYLYYIFDSNKFEIGSNALRELIFKIDSNNT